MNEVTPQTRDFRNEFVVELKTSYRTTSTMSTNNAYITEEYLHRRVADVLRDAAKLEENLNGSEVEVSVVAPIFI